MPPDPFYESANEVVAFVVKIAVNFDNLIG